MVRKRQSSIALNHGRRPLHLSLFQPTLYTLNEISEPYGAHMRPPNKQDRVLCTRMPGKLHSPQLAVPSIEGMHLPLRSSYYRSHLVYSLHTLED